MTDETKENILLSVALAGLVLFILTILGVPLAFAIAATRWLWLAV